MENAFGILKQSFSELHSASDLHVTLLHVVMVCYCILHNLLLGQSAEEVDSLLAMLQRKGMALVLNEEPMQERPDQEAPPRDEVQGEQKRGQ